MTAASADDPPPGPPGEKSHREAAPNIGHAQRLPGHIDSPLGRWADAAFAIGAATRVEHRCVRDEF